MKSHGFKFSGQNASHGVHQYKNDRDPKAPREKWTKEMVIFPRHHQLD